MFGRPVTRVPVPTPWFLARSRPAVREVLAGADGAFSVREYGNRMRDTTGDFVLGMDDGPEYRRLREAVAVAFPFRSKEGERDEARLGRMARRHAERAVDAARLRHPGRAGRIDAIRDVANVVPVRVVEGYFGLPDPDPATGCLLSLNQGFSAYIFGPGMDVPPLRWLLLGWRDPWKAAKTLRLHVEQSIADRRAARMVEERSVLGRLLAARERGQVELAEDEVAPLLIGLASGALIATIGLFAEALRKLLTLPAERRARFRELVRSTAAEDRPEADRWLREAARFGAYPPFLYRVAARDHPLLEGTPHETSVPRGALVVADVRAAAMDGIERPREFDPARPDADYTLFGHGLHYCIGDFLGRILHYEMARALFALPGLRPAGKLRGSPYPETFPLAFGPPGRDRSEGSGARAPRSRRPSP